MSSPMYDLPEHLPMAVNAAGQGPETDSAQVVATVCWCGKPECQRWRDRDQWYEDD